VDGDLRAARPEVGERSGRGSRRIAGNGVDRDDLDAESVDLGAFELGGLVRAPSDEHDSVRVQQRAARSGAGETGHDALDIQHVGQTHPVQGALMDGGGNVEVGVAVEVGEARLPAEGGDGADADRAVAADDQRQVPVGPRCGHARGRVADDVDHRGRGLGPGGVAVRAPAEGRAIAAIGHVQSRSTQCLPEARRPERGGRLLLARGERARAGRHADQGHGPHGVRPNPFRLGASRRRGPSSRQPPILRALTTVP
jgi:hypothetical protein